MMDKKKYDSIINDLMEFDSNMIPLSKHIKGIAEYFNVKSYPNDIYNWFWISSSINSVDYDGIRQDCAFEMCRPAYEYETEKQKLHSQLVSNLTIFLFVYNGFESLVNYMNLPKHPKFNGKISATRYYIKNEFSDYFQKINGYQEALFLLKSLMKDSSLNENIIYFSGDDCTDLNGIGLKVVYKLRNKLAHGDFIFPEPMDWNLELPFESEIIELCTRLLLFSIQMLMLAKNRDCYEELEMYDSEVFYDENSDADFIIDEALLLKTLHIPRIDEDESQFKIEFN